MPTDPTSIGTSPRRAGACNDLAPHQVNAKMTEATVTRARCAESMWSATPAFGQIRGAFSGLPPVSIEHGKTAKGKAMSADGK